MELKFLAIAPAAIAVTAAPPMPFGACEWVRFAVIGAAVGAYAASGLALLTNTRTNRENTFLVFVIRLTTSFAIGICSVLISTKFGHATMPLETAGIAAVGAFFGAALYPVIVKKLTAVIKRDDV